MSKAKTLIGIIFLVGVLSACSTPVPVNGEGAGFDMPIADPSDTRTIVRPIDEISDCDFPSPSTGPRTVYFDFDSYVVREDGRALVQDHAARVIKDKRNILIQGSTDERGGTEYNLALGQKRAEAVRKALAVLGVAEDQMETVSVGKEKQIGEGHDEETWQRNRRADIIYKAR